MSDEKENNQGKNQDKEKDEQEAPKELDFTMFNELVGRQSVLYNPIWMNDLLKLQDTKPDKFKRERIIEWLKNPARSEMALRELSQYFSNSSLHYKRIVFYLASMLTFDHVITPVNATAEDMMTSAFQKNYRKVINWLNDFNLKEEFTKIMRIVMAEDVYYGYKRYDGGKFRIQKLPSDWCKLVSRNENGYQYAFDMTYFLLPAVNIDHFPPEFKTYVRELKKGGTNTGTYWVLLDPDKSVVFKFDENIATIVPPLLGVFLDVLEINNFRDLIKARATLDTYKLLHQKIPMSQGKDAKPNQFLIDLNNAAKFHKNTKSNLPQGVELATSPMDLNSIDIEKSQNKDSVVGVAEENYFKSVGVSQLLFGETSNSVGLKYSMQNDEAFVIHMYRQFERFVNNELAKLTGSFNFKILFPDITYYNRSYKQEQFLKAAQYGYPKSLYGASLGLSPNHLEGMVDLENAMKLHDKMIPLRSSHTDSGNSEGGRPQESDSKVSESGVKTRDNESNQNRET